MLELLFYVRSFIRPRRKATLIKKSFCRFSKTGRYILSYLHSNRLSLFNYEVRGKRGKMAFKINNSHFSIIGTKALNNFRFQPLPGGNKRKMELGEMGETKK